MTVKPKKPIVLQNLAAASHPENAESGHSMYAKPNVAFFSLSTIIL